jgi:putative tryptophan/tyrosine transport system substrate-binding protein
MRRREILAGMCLAATMHRAQARPSALPVIGFLSPGSPESEAFRVTGFRQGLSETGYQEGLNVAIEFRWAGSHYDGLPELAAELVGLSVDVIAAGPIPATLAAKAATSTIPIVFANGNDPVRFGLVDNLNRPSGNVTGISYLTNVLAPKQLELLHDIVPEVVTLGYLVNPSNPNVDNDMKAVNDTANILGLTLIVLAARTPQEIEGAFAALIQQRIGAVLIHSDAFFTSQHKQLASLAARHATPALYHFREFAAAGGLISYGSSLTEGYRLFGTYVGRILKGERPAELPVQQSAKIELVINLKAAKTLGIEIPSSLLARADEVIE